MLAGVVLLRGVPETIEAPVPEVLEPGAQLGGSGGPGPVEAACPVAAFRDETRLSEDGKVLADGRPRDVEPPSDLAGRQLALADEAEDRPTAGLGEGLESRIDHHLTLVATYVSVN